MAEVEMNLHYIKKFLKSTCWFVLFASLLILSTRVSAEEWTYTVRAGDNLWNLTEQHLTSMRYVKRLQQLNKIQNPNVIQPGTKIRIPVSWTRYHFEAQALIVGVHGVVTIQRKDASVRLPAELGMQLFVGDEIQSENDSFVTVEFLDKSRLRVQDNSHVRLENMEIFGDYGLVDTLIDLQNGRTENFVSPEPDTGTRFRIQTPSAISSVRGTDFRVGVLNEGEHTSSEVLTGSVQVSGETRRIKVPAGFGAVTTQGAPPSKPVTLLPPPDLSETSTFYESLPLVVNLKPLEKAQSYRAQIAIDKNFENLWVEFTTAQLPFRDGDVPDGDYWLRVRGIDASGIEGQNAVIAFSLNARPEPPFVTAPLPGGVVDVDNQEFHWARQSEAAHYAVMISAEEDFSSLVFFDPEIKGTSLQLSESLPPGHYFWQIFSVAASERAGPFSDVMSFRVPYPGPALENTAFDETEMTFAWRAGAEGQSFHFQLAHDEAFNDLLYDQYTTASQATVPLPDGGNYYLRIKTIESDGFEGPWGPPQIIEIPRDTPYWLLLLLLPLLILI